MSSLYFTIVLPLAWQSDFLWRTNVWRDNGASLNMQSLWLCLIDFQQAAYVMSLLALRDSSQRGICAHRVTHGQDTQVRRQATETYLMNKHTRTHPNTHSVIHRLPSNPQSNLSGCMDQVQRQCDFTGDLVTIETDNDESHTILTKWH